VVPGTPILQIFDEHAGQLLILGAPGAGKTILLLKLARALISRAEKSPTERIPVIFALSTWGNEQPPLEDWLAAELHQSYGISKELAQKWITSLFSRKPVIQCALIASSMRRRLLGSFFGLTPQQESAKPNSNTSSEGRERGECYKESFIINFLQV
jgi:hypothetical protein